MQHPNQAPATHPAPQVPVPTATRIARHTELAGGCGDGAAPGSLGTGRLAPPAAWLIGAVVLGLSAACNTPGAGAQQSTVAAPARVAAESPETSPPVEAGATVDPFAPKPWTDAFLQRAVVVADHVRIEGPVGLLEHCVVSSDDAFYERSVSHEGTTLTQVTVRLSPEVPEIRAQLDQWQFAAFQRVTVIERKEPCDVTVVATGEACLRDPLGKEERGETLRWVGTIVR